MSRKIKEKSRKVEEKPKEVKLPIEELGKITGIHPVYIKGIKRMENLENGFELTFSELQKLKIKHYGGT